MRLLQVILYFLFEGSMIILTMHCYLLVFFVCAIFSNVDAECDLKATVLTTAPGEINFHDEPQSTPLGQGQVDRGGTIPGCDREWILIPPKGRYVAVTVVSVQNITCGDQLYISSHLSDTRSPGWSVCDFRGGNTPRLFDQPRYLASHREEKIIIQYRRGSSNFSGGRGFEIVYDFKEPGCNGQAVLTGSPSWFATHPGAGAWAVEAGLHCAWQIVAPPDQFVSIHSHNVWLHCSSKWQTLEVYDAPKELSSALVTRIYCTDQMVSVASSGRYMFIKYDDRWASNSLGFNLTYQSHKRRQCGCGGDYELTAPTGTLLSHKDFDSSDGMLVRQKYLPWSRCQWLILMPATALVTLRFDHFDVRGKSSAGLCYGDMLVVHDGSSNRTIGQTFCDSYQEPFSLTSTSSSLGVRFLTGPMESMDTRGTGFILTYFATCNMPPRIPGTNVTFIDSNNDGLDIVTYGESILFTCQPGYNMAGGDVIKTCLGNGTFSGIDLQCMPVRCHDIPIIANTQSYYTDVNLDGDTVVSFREVVTYECTMGYFLMSGDQERRCQQNGSFSGTDVVCEALMCHIPPIPHTTHTFLMHNENLTYLHEVEYVCDYGYRTNSGDSVRMCQADGSLSGQNLDCKPVTCAYVPEIPQTNISYVDLNRDGKDIVTFGETVTYHCQKGYLRSAAGNETRFCMADGTLNGTDVACYAIRCLDVPLLPYSTMTSTDSNDDGEEIISYREAANYQCLQGYYRKSGSERRICQSSGSLDGEDLVCAPRQCNIIPVPENTEYFSEDTNNDGQDTVTFTEVVHYVCRNGFFPMGGNLKRTCQHDGQLNGTDLYCKAVDCKAPPKVENAVVMVTETSLGSVAHYFCNAGYQSQGRHTFSGECSKNGDWIGEFTDCSGVFCKPPASIPNAVTSVGNHAAKPWGSYINITCLPGYLMEHVTGGVVTWTCQGNGSWEGLKVSCKAIDDRPSRSNGNQSYDWIIFVIAVVCATVLIAIMVAVIAILTDKRRRISTKMRRLRREYESSSLSSPPLSSRGTPSCLSDRNLLAGGLPLAYPGGMFVSEASKEMYEDIWRWYKISDAENLADDRNDTGTRAHFNQFSEAPLYMHSVDGPNCDLNEKDFIEPTNTEQRISQARDWGNSMLQQRGTKNSRDSSPGNQFRLDDGVIPKQWEKENMRPEEEIIIYEDLTC